MRLDSHWLQSSKISYLFLQGQIPAPKTFQSASVFLCDIVGFTKLASESTAHQTIEMLNQLYRLFDITISYYQVYKARTLAKD